MNAELKTSAGFVRLGLLAWFLAVPLGRNLHAQSPLFLDLPQTYGRDSGGTVIDAHDGCVMQFGGKFYLYGTAYGPNNNAFLPYANRFACYSSTDLQHWTQESTDLLNGNEGGGIYMFRPHVIYNQANNLYILWFNWWAANDSNPAYLAVATSLYPNGPFSIVTQKVLESPNNPLHAGDFCLFVDNDPNQTGYVIYSTYVPNQTPQIFIERLTSDYLALRGQNGETGDKSPQVGYSGAEAPLLFKKDSEYYAIMGGNCCACSWGADATVYECKDSTPLGLVSPWSSSGYDINQTATGARFEPAQPTYVAQVSTAWAGNRYIFIGDLWTGGGCWSDPGSRNHDGQYWSPPLKFDQFGHIKSLSDQSRTMVLMNNNASEGWGDNARVVAFASDGTPTVIGTHYNWWYPYDFNNPNDPNNANAIWTIDLSQLTVGQYYTIELQDIFNGVTTLVPHQNLIIAGWSISGYVHRPGVGGYFGWFTEWNGQPGASTANFTLSNQGTGPWNDNLRIVAYLNNGGTPTVVGTRTGYWPWNPQQTWTLSLSALTASYPYSFEVQDMIHGNALIPYRSIVIQPQPYSNGSAGNGYIWNPGGGGYQGWFTVWNWFQAQ